MTLKALLAQSRRVPALVGETCARASTGAYEWALLLYFGVLHPADETGYREQDKTIVVECPWRLETQDEVIVGSGNKDGTVDERIQVCVGRRVTDARIYLPSYTVKVRFEGDLILWIFPNDSRDYASVSEYPRSPWYLVGRAFPGGWEE